MIYRLLTYLTLTFLIFSFSSCSKLGNKTNTNAHTSKTLTGKSILNQLDGLFADLTNISEGRHSTSKLKSNINQEIKMMIEAIETPSLLENFSYLCFKKKHDFDFTITNDGRLAVFSWDTKMGKSATRFTNIVLLKNPKNIITRVLETPAISYDDIYTIKGIDGQTIYLFHGKNLSATQKNYRVDAYTVGEKKLIPAFVFPEDQNSITASFEENTSYADFELEQDGSLIFVPRDSGEDLVYTPFIFDGARYQEDSSSL